MHNKKRKEKYIDVTKALIEDFDYDYGEKEELREKWKKKKQG